MSAGRPARWWERLMLWLSGAAVIERPEPGQPVAVAPPPIPPSPVPPESAPPATAEPAPAVPHPLIPPQAPQEELPVSDEVINDAVAYGVSIAAADVPVGATYWRAVRVHHLTPDENHGNHHIFLDALDEAGRRVYGARARVTWEGGEQVVTIDKPLNEPGANFPMWKWQVCAVEMLGLPSDRVLNLHTAHPDEPPGTGNTLFHHSFHIDFRRSVKTTPQPPAQSVIRGRVSRAEGKTLVLTRDGAAVASTVLDAAGEFSFTSLPAGTYQLVIEGTGVQSALLTVDGTNTLTVNLELPAAPPPAKPLSRYVLFGPAYSPRTAVYLSLAREYLARSRPTFGFSAEEARLARRVVIIGETADVSQEVEADLIAAGCQVRRIRGTPEEVAAALKALDGGHSIFLPMTSGEQ